jgi:Cu/Ag efflux protein CusF
VAVTATVDAVDQKTRSVHAEERLGEKHTFIAGDEVRNLAQLAVATSSRSSTAGRRRAPRADHEQDRERTVTEAVDRAKPGQKPGGVAIREVKAVASIEKIDTKSNVVTLRGPEHTVDLKVNDPAMLKGVKVGDFVERAIPRRSRSRSSRQRNDMRTLPRYLATLGTAAGARYYFAAKRSSRTASDWQDTWLPRADLGVHRQIQGAYDEGRWIPAGLLAAALPVAAANMATTFRPRTSPRRTR